MGNFVFNGSVEMVSKVKLKKYPLFRKNVIDGTFLYGNESKNNTRKTYGNNFNTFQIWKLIEP